MGPRVRVFGPRCWGDGVIGKGVMGFQVRVRGLGVR